jgi:hypothetical protein
MAVAGSKMQKPILLINKHFSCNGPDKGHF